MDDLQTILDQLNDRELDYVTERSRVTTETAALKAAGIGKTAFYEWPEERRAFLSDVALKLKRRAKVRAQLVLEEAAERAAERIVELIDSKNPNVALRAASDLLDRTAGKPTQRQEITGAQGGDIVIRWSNDLDDNTP